MDSEIDRLYDRLRLYDLIEDYPNWRCESYAEVIGCSTRWVHKGKQRFQEAGKLTLKVLLSLSRALNNRPGETPIEVKTFISDLRVELGLHYHRVAGSRLILHELEKHREKLESQGYFVPDSPHNIAKNYLMLSNV